MYSFGFVHLGVFYFSLIFGRKILSDITLLVDSFFLQHFKYVIPQFSGLHGSDEKLVVDLIEDLL